MLIYECYAQFYFVPSLEVSICEETPIFQSNVQPEASQWLESESSDEHTETAPAIVQQLQGALF
jgi:hypothetical protein